jgi:hypothetical protein
MTLTLVSQLNGMNQMKLSELVQDPVNANIGTLRGKTAVEVSLATCGAGRSIVTDRNGTILAGNKTAAAAQLAGLNQEVILVDSDGSKLVVVRRTDLDAADKKAKTLAVADNRTAELGLEWDPTVLKDLSTVLDLQPYFSTGELQEIINPTVEEAEGDKELTMSNDLTFKVIVECASEQEQFELLTRFEKEGLKCQALTS